jgi:hypothetical protein
VGYLRQYFYEICRAYQTSGLKSPIERRSSLCNPHPNRFSLKVKRTNRTRFNECFRAAGRQTWYLTTAEI